MATSRVKQISESERGVVAIGDGLLWQHKIGDSEHFCEANVTLLKKGRKFCQVEVRLILGKGNKSKAYNGATRFAPWEELFVEDFV